MNLNIKAELIFWLITLVIVSIVLLPIFQYYGTEYPFYIENIPMIIVFLTYTRYIFLLKYAPFSKNKLVKLFFIFLSIPLFFIFMDSLFDFQRYLDEVGFVGISKGNDADYAASMARYSRYQFIFFGTGAIFVLFVIPIRMVVSIWRVANNKAKV